MVNSFDLFNAGIVVAGGFAFASRAKYEMRQRAKNKSELSGKNDRPFEAAHLNHAKGEGYENKKNGLLVTDIEHAAHHIMHRGNAEVIGLEEHQNEWAIHQILSRVYYFSQIREISKEQTDMEIAESITLWEERLNGNS